MEWLDAHALPRSVVLASVETSNRIPRFTGCRVFAGHNCQTLDFSLKERFVGGFFRESLTIEQRASFLARFRIEWLMVGPREREIGPFDPSTSPLFTEVFRAGAVALYAARRQ